MSAAHQHEKQDRWHSRADQDAQQRGYVTQERSPPRRRSDCSRASTIGFPASLPPFRPSLAAAAADSDMPPSAGCSSERFNSICRCKVVRPSMSDVVRQCFPIGMQNLCSLSGSFHSTMNPHLQRVGHLHVHGYHFASDAGANCAGTAGIPCWPRVQPCAARVTQFQSSVNCHVLSTETIHHFNAEERQKKFPT